MDAVVHGRGAGIAHTTPQHRAALTVLSGVEALGTGAGLPHGGRVGSSPPGDVGPAVCVGVFNPGLVASTSSCKGVLVSLGGLVATPLETSEMASNSANNRSKSLNECGSAPLIFSSSRMLSSIIFSWLEAITLFNEYLFRKFQKEKSSSAPSQ